MTGHADICSLEYLTGTLATFYKGMITSLVAKDFCISKEGGGITLRGTIMSMPSGDYRASLIREGRELASTQLLEGFFELRTDADVVGAPGDLQIDVIQNGRHIGTFLLKKSKDDGLFMPAMELAHKMQGMDLKLLTRYLRDKPGLLKKAEAIVSQILSTKRDWRNLSEEINSFAPDIFWSAPDAFYSSYGILVRFALNACEKADVGLRDKTIANFLSLISLPLEKEADEKKLRTAVVTWLDELKGSSACLGCNFSEARAVIEAIMERFPDIDPGPALKPLMASLKSRAGDAPAIPDAVLKILGKFMDADLGGIAGLGESSRRNTMIRINEAEILLEEGEYRKIFDTVGDAALPEDAELIEEVFTALENHVAPASAGPLSEAVFTLFSGLGALSDGGRRKAIAGTARLLQRLIGLGLIDECEHFLARIEEAALPHNEDVILNVEVASAIRLAGNETLLAHYVNLLKKIIVPAPRISGFSSDTWAEIARPLHIARLTKFLEIIALDSGKFEDVLIHLICNLHVSGVFITDDRLFQRNVSSYLNSDEPGEKFLLNCMLLQMLPVYYNEVGATGRIRDYTTRIDSWGNDPVLYFLRKQVHVNSSNRNIVLVESIMKAWAYRDPGALKGAVPEDVVSRIDRTLLTRYSAAGRSFFEACDALDDSGLHLEKILAVSEEELGRSVEVLDTSAEIRSKLFLLSRLYQELVDKYACACGPFEARDIYTQLDDFVGRLKGLKEIIVSPEKTLPVESLYFKRHIAFGIPSVMGSYHEPKFDAFGDMLRTEERIRVLLEKMVAVIREKKGSVSNDDVRGWVRGLRAVNELFSVHGLGNFLVDELATILATNALRLSQTLDMLKIWQRELTWMVDSLFRAFYRPLAGILKTFPEEDLPERLKGLGPGGPEFIDKAADLIMRDLLNSISGFTELDRILGELASALSLHLAEGVDEEFAFSDGLRRKEEYFVMDELSNNDAMMLAPLIGGKAKNLVYLRNKGLPVPPGVVFPATRTAAYREYAASSTFRSTAAEAIRKIEERAGALFGDPLNPLFVSVRSGSYVSMPGILSSILYCGINEETLNGFISTTGNGLLGWDSYRRFIEHYATVVHGIREVFFGEILAGFMAEKGVLKLADLDAGLMEELVRRYLRALLESGIAIPGDVYEQLRRSVEAIYASWFSEKAVQFRKAMNVSVHWGTSVAVMQMIYGNDKGCGASVFFTRQPFSLEAGVYGDTKGGVTGDDIVHGEFASAPITRRQALAGQRSLEESDPELFRMHQELASRIEEAMGGLPQEVEVTYRMRADGRRQIHVLQTRRMEFHRGFRKSFEDVCEMSSKVLGRGAGVHGGALSGVATFASSPEEVRKLKREAALPVILLRPTASTEDVSLMDEVDGILTRTGGVASHASVLAQKFDLTAVVGCSEMEFGADEGGPHALIGNREIREGSHISIDGSTGLVYSGLCVFTVTNP